MPEWLNSSLSGNDVLTRWGLWLLFWRISVAFGLGVAVAFLYRWAKRGEYTSPTFTTTLILLAGLIAMATEVIGGNVARAFSLVGALSVVRFRTVVKDTQDTAFVILAVVVGMAAGASQLAVGLIGLGLLIAVAPFMWSAGRPDGWERDEGTLRLKVEGSEVVRHAVEAVFTATLQRQRLLSVATAKKGAALELSYSVRLRPGGSPLELIADLNRIEGVSGVELTRND